MITIRQHGGPDKNLIGPTGKKAVKYFIKVIINRFITTAIRRRYAALRARYKTPPLAVLKGASVVSTM